ncbi:MAG: DegT/DnrJ/EryC1/StrS family aminotransferase [Chryseolinea sp.]
MIEYFVPVNTPLLEGNEKKYLNECIDTGWISSEGSFLTRFESGFSSYVDRKYGVAVSSGSAALDIAIHALGIEKGDEVIMPTFTIISPALSVVRAGAIPVLVDSDPVTWNMDVGQISAKINSRTKAIVVVHIYGLPADMDPIIKLCNRHKLLLIEDAAEMHGQTYDKRRCGSFGNVSIFSFYPNKHITCGEGGMIVTDDKVLEERCRRLRNLAFEPSVRRFVHFDMGWNYRMTNMQAAIGLAQFEKIDQHLIKKRETGNRYNEGLKGLKDFMLPLSSTAYAENIYCMYGVVASSEAIAQMTVRKLHDDGVDTRPFFWCMHEQPVFRQMGLFANEKYPTAERLARCGFYLPSGTGISHNQINHVINSLNPVAP